MRVAYILAHFDDEYAALPLLRRDLAADRATFLYVADYGTAELAARRERETQAFILHMGFDPERVRHVGRATGALDGQVHRALPQAREALFAAMAGLGRIDRIVTTAWEGGHPDHDACAWLATAAAARFQVPALDQFSLYNARGVPAPLFRAAAPIPENGPTSRLRLRPRGWAAWASDVRFFPSQARTWAGLLPMMGLSFLRRGGFEYQRLESARVSERPHKGELLYERMFHTPYEEVREALDQAAATA
jgi:N-acetylglucosamine malate deacetylase 1